MSAADVRAASLPGLPVPVDAETPFRSSVGLIVGRAAAAMDAVAAIKPISAEARLSLLDWWFWLAAHQLARELAGGPLPMPVLMPRTRPITRGER